MKLPKRIRHVNFKSSIARFFLNFIYYDGKVYRIPFGPLRGYKLTYDSSITFHMMLGLYELYNVELLSRVFENIKDNEPNPVIYDVGANVGFHSLWFSKVFSSDPVFAFEPTPMLIDIIEENIAINDINNINVVRKAVSDRKGKANFHLGHHHSASKIISETKTSSTDSITVDTISLDTFVNSSECAPPSFIKLDIEGAAAKALNGAKNVIQTSRPVCLIESHSHEEDRAISDLVVNQEYRAFRINNEEWVPDPKKIHPDPDGIWGGLLLFPAESRSLYDFLL